MPELPEVEVVRRGLAPHVAGRRVRAVQCFRRELRYPLPDLSILQGQRLLDVGRRSKYLLFGLQHDRILAWHLGMTGQFHVLPADAPRAKHEHVRLLLDDENALVYRDARRFGYAGLIAAAELKSHPWFARLGPEPLGGDFNSDYLIRICRGRKRPIKPLIMDAAIVVGVGNIYASESLFRAGIHPARAAGRIAAPRLARLVDCIREVLNDAIEAGGSSISDFVRADGRPGYFAHSFAVYGREGEPCSRCGRPLRRRVQAGRSSFYCNGCQH